MMKDGIRSDPLDLLRPDVGGLRDPQRCAALADSAMMGSDPEDEFDRAVRLATRVLGVPVALVSFIDRNHEYFKAMTGLSGALAKERRLTVAQSLGRYIIESKAPAIFSDLRKEPDLADHPAVGAHPGVAYAGVPLATPDGHVLGVFSVMDTCPRTWTDENLEALHDLARLVEAELALRSVVSHQELILEEMAHRTKNLFSMINGMLRIDMRQASSARELADRLARRISALDKAHGLIVPVLAASKISAPATDLHQLIATLLAPHSQGSEERISLWGPPVRVGEKAVVYMALAIHEIATNAAKYGALSHPDGRIEITWDIEEGEVILSWTEIKTPKPRQTPPQGGGFGSRLLQIAIVSQLGGNIEASPETEGAAEFAMDIRLPVSVLAH